MRKHHALLHQGVVTTDDLRPGFGLTLPPLAWSRQAEIAIALRLVQAGAIVTN